MMWRVTPPDFAPAWARLVTAWRTLGEDGPEGEVLLRRAVDEGVHALDLPAAGEVAVGQGRRCEIAVVRLAGAVDEAGYLAHNQSQAERGAEPVDHFCRRGWRALRNPSLDFDVWWYWAEYLDPTDESQTATNPLVHYLLDGRHRGLLPLPRRRPRDETTVPVRPRRACLFAAYDPDGLVDDTVVAYVSELARHAKVFVCFDGSLQPGQLDRLSGLVAGAWVRPHGAHDFGSWSVLARELVGWDALAATALRFTAAHHADRSRSAADGAAAHGSAGRHAGLARPCLGCLCGHRQDRGRAFCQGRQIRSHRRWQS